MTTPSPDPIGGVLAMIAERRTALDALANAIETCRDLDLFGQAAVAPLLIQTPAAATLPAPAASMPQKTRGPKPKLAVARTGKGGRGRVARPDLTPAVLSFLERQRQPTTFGTIVEALKSRPALVRPVIDALVDAKHVVRVGVKNGQRIGLPGVMGQATTPAPVKARQAEANPSVGDEIAKVLLDGASHDAREIYRRCRGHVPDLDMDDVTTALEQMARSGHVDRIPISEGVVRYRRRGKVKATA